VKIALIHDWLVRYRGGEKVLEAIYELYPEADIFTLLHRPGSVSPALERRLVRTSFLQKLPGVYSAYRNFLPLFPAAIESFDLRGYELIISSSHCVAKGVRKEDGALHLSYVHSPMRYMWDRFEDYFGPGRAPLPKSCSGGDSPMATAVGSRQRAGRGSIRGQQSLHRRKNRAPVWAPGNRGSPLRRPSPLRDPAVRERWTRGLLSVGGGDRALQAPGYRPSSVRFSSTAAVGCWF